MPVVSASVPALRDLFQTLTSRMDKAVGDFRSALASIRTGRASIHLLDGVRVEYYGTEMPLNQLATVHAPDPQLITIQPYDVGSLNSIEKAIRAADLGLNPANDGKMIRVPIPALNEERRKELVKHLHKVLEDHRTAVRNIRRDGNDGVKKLKAEKKVSEDEERRAHEDVQKLTDDELAKLEASAGAKEKEILTV
ncbi:MAG: ribosome recycling factor [Terriglobales bacterium]